jgi:hypothetical protein
VIINHHPFGAGAKRLTVAEVALSAAIRRSC